MKKIFACAALLALSAGLAACSNDVGLQQRTSGKYINEAQGGSVEVKPGDTVYSISRRHNVPMSTLIRENKLQQPYVLQPGQMLRVPGASFEDSTGLVDNGAAANGYVATRTVEGVDLNGDLGGSPAPEAVPVTTDSLQPLGSSAGSTTPLTPLPVQGETVGKHEMILTPTGPVTTPKPGEVQVPGSAAIPSESDAVSDTVAIPDSAATTTAAAPAKGTFGWPIEGKASGANGGNGTAVEISAPKGTAVTSAAGGTVVSAGSDSVTIQHPGGYVSTYSPLERVLVDKDAIVAKGDAIGTLASSGGKAAQLHFGIAKGGQPLDAMAALPTR